MENLHHCPIQNDQSPPLALQGNYKLPNPLRALHHMISSHSPDIIFLSEPMTLSPSSALLSSLGADGFHSNNPLSTASLWCLFRIRSNHSISLIDFSTQFLTISFTNPANGCKCLLSGIYGSTNYFQSRGLWNYISINAPTNLPWWILGDFNAILLASEKLSFRPSRLVQDF